MTIFVKEGPATPLCKLAEKYGTNKCLAVEDHYTLFYYRLMKERRKTVKKVLEMGVGCPAEMPIKGYKAGASLKMWRDFFPNAWVYGGDIRPEAMLTGEPRITTFLVDERKPEDLAWLIGETGRDIDLFVDDALHFPDAQADLAIHLRPMLSKETIYIIEDLPNPWAVAARLEAAGLEYEYVRFQHKAHNYERLMVVKPV